MTTVKSTSITNLDAIPPTRNTEGEGGAATLRHIGDFATTTANLVQQVNLVRIPSTAKVKAVFLESAAQTQGTFDVGLYYSTAALDGTQPANSGAVISVAFFASAIDCSSAVARVDRTNESGTYTVAKRNQPIWQAAGLSSDPGGFFDVCATSTNTVTTGGLLSLEVLYAD